jgi:hypothetical protein
MNSFSWHLWLISSKQARNYMSRKSEKLLDKQHENGGFHLFQPNSLTGKTATCSYENLWGRARKLIQRFRWLPRLLSSKQARNFMAHGHFWGLLLACLEIH